MGYLIGLIIMVLGAVNLIFWPRPFSMLSAGWALGIGFIIVVYEFARKR